MTSNFKSLKLALLFSFVSLSAALAADIGRPMGAKAPPKLDEDPIPGVYLRGDIGISNYTTTAGEYRDLTANTINPITGASIGRGFNGGIGVGYKDGFMRYELTVDYRAPSAYSDSTVCWAAGCGAGIARNSGKVESVVALANVYADLGTWYSFTPYIGAGLGVSLNTLKDYQAQTYNGAALVNTSVGKKSTQKIAFALMVGSAYHINKNMALDFGYRYLNIGKAETSPTGAAVNEQWSTGRLAAHELRAGVRYTLD